MIFSSTHRFQPILRGILRDTLTYLARRALTGPPASSIGSWFYAIYSDALSAEMDGAQTDSSVNTSCTRIVLALAAGADNNPSSLSQAAESLSHACSTIAVQAMRGAEASVELQPAPAANRTGVPALPIAPSIDAMHFPYFPAPNVEPIVPVPRVRRNSWFSCFSSSDEAEPVDVSASVVLPIQQLIGSSRMGDAIHGEPKSPLELTGMHHLLFKRSV